MTLVLSFCKVDICIRLLRAVDRVAMCMQKDPLTTARQSQFFQCLDTPPFKGDTEKHYLHSPHCDDLRMLERLSLSFPLLSSLALLQK